MELAAHTEGWERHWEILDRVGAPEFRPDPKLLADTLRRAGATQSPKANRRTRAASSAPGPVNGDSTTVPSGSGPSTSGLPPANLRSHRPASTSAVGPLLRARLRPASLKQPLGRATPPPQHDDGAAADNLGLSRHNHPQQQRPQHAWGLPPSPHDAAPGPMDDGPYHATAHVPPLSLVGMRNAGAAAPPTASLSTATVGSRGGSVGGPGAPDSGPATPILAGAGMRMYTSLPLQAGPGAALLQLNGTWREPARGAEPEASSGDDRVGHDGKIHGKGASTPSFSLSAPSSLELSASISLGSPLPPLPMPPSLLARLEATAAAAAQDDSAGAAFGSSSGAADAALLSPGALASLRAPPRHPPVCTSPTQEPQSQSHPMLKQERSQGAWPTPDLDPACQPSPRLLIAQRSGAEAPAGGNASVAAASSTPGAPASPGPSASGVRAPQQVSATTTPSDQAPRASSPTPRESAGGRAPSSRGPSASGVRPAQQQQSQTLPALDQSPRATGLSPRVGGAGGGGSLGPQTSVFWSPVAPRERYRSILERLGRVAAERRKERRRKGATAAAARHPNLRRQQAVVSASGPSSSDEDDEEEEEGNGTGRGDPFMRAIGGLSGWARRWHKPLATYATTTETSTSGAGAGAGGGGGGGSRPSNPSRLGSSLAGTAPPVSALLREREMLRARQRQRAEAATAAAGPEEHAVWQLSAALEELSRFSCLQAVCGPRMSDGSVLAQVEARILAMQRQDRGGRGKGRGGGGSLLPPPPPVFPLGAAVEYLDAASRGVTGLESLEGVVRGMRHKLQHVLGQDTDDLRRAAAEALREMGVDPAPPAAAAAATAASAVAHNSFGASPRSGGSAAPGSGAAAGSSGAGDRPLEVARRGSGFGALPASPSLLQQQHSSGGLSSARRDRAGSRSPSRASYSRPTSAHRLGSSLGMGLGLGLGQASENSVGRPASRPPSGRRTPRSTSPQPHAQPSDAAAYLAEAFHIPPNVSGSFGSQPRGGTGDGVAPPPPPSLPPNSPSFAHSHSAHALGSQGSRLMGSTRGSLTQLRSSASGYVTPVGGLDQAWSLLESLVIDLHDSHAVRADLVSALEEQTAAAAAASAAAEGSGDGTSAGGAAVDIAKVEQPTPRDAVDGGAADPSGAVAAASQGAGPSTGPRMKLQRSRSAVDRLVHLMDKTMETVQANSTRDAGGGTASAGNGAGDAQAGGEGGDAGGGAAKGGGEAAASAAAAPLLRQNVMRAAVASALEPRNTEQVLYFLTKLALMLQQDPSLPPDAGFLVGMGTDLLLGELAWLLALLRAAAGAGSPHLAALAAALRGYEGQRAHAAALEAAAERLEVALEDAEDRAAHAERQLANSRSLLRNAGHNVSDLSAYTRELEKEVEQLRAKTETLEETLAELESMERLEAAVAAREATLAEADRLAEAMRGVAEGRPATAAPLGSAPAQAAVVAAAEAQLRLVEERSVGVQVATEGHCGDPRALPPALLATSAAYVPLTPSVSNRSLDLGGPPAADTAPLPLSAPPLPFSAPAAAATAIAGSPGRVTPVHGEGRREGHGWDGEVATAAVHGERPRSSSPQSRSPSPGSQKTRKVPSKRVRAGSAGSYAGGGGTMSGSGGGSGKGGVTAAAVRRRSNSPTLSLTVRTSMGPLAEKLSGGSSHGGREGGSHAGEAGAARETSTVPQIAVAAAAAAAAAAGSGAEAKRVEVSPEDPGAQRPLSARANRVVFADTVQT